MTKTRFVTLARWRALLELLWSAAPWHVALFGVVIVIHGLLPTALNLTTGFLVYAIPAAIASGVSESGSRSALLALGALLFGFTLSAVVSNAMRPLSHIVNSAFALEVQRICARAMLQPPGIAAIENPAVANELHAIQEADSRGVLRRTAMMIAAVIGFRMVGFGALILLFGFRWWAPFPLAIGWYLVNRVFVRAMERGLDVDVSDGAALQRRAEYMRSLVLEPLAAKEIRVFGLASWMVQGYADAWSDALKLMWRSRSSGWLAVWATVVLTAAHAIVLGALALAAASGEVDAARLVVFARAVVASCALGLVGESQWWLAQSLAAAGRAAALRSRLPSALSQSPPPSAPSPPPRAVEPPRPLALAPSRRSRISVRLDNVAFTYPGREHRTLDGLTLDIPPGQSLAIVGENGAGKSTLIKLLCGLYEPDSGRITVDDVSPVEARGRVGIIFQDFVRYKLPLRENVAFGHLPLLRHPTVLEEALRDAGGSGLLARLPHGWDTVLSREYTGGADLSGGEWQRVALARALTAVRGGAGLLILDEPTASLDVRAETELFDRFLELTGGVTTILVSHRLSSVRRAGRIVVLEGGRVVEDGTHTDLMRADGRYAAMFTLQAAAFADTVNDCSAEEVTHH